MTDPADLARKLRAERIEGWLPAFDGLRDDLIGRLRASLIDAEQEATTLARADLYSLAKRIQELSALATQGALVATDPAHAGWGIPDGWEPEPEQSDAQQPLPDGAVACSEPICGLQTYPDGENLYRCPSGHLTVAETPKEPAE